MPNMMQLEEFCNNIPETQTGKKGKVQPRIPGFFFFFFEPAIAQMVGRQSCTDSGA